MILNRKTKKMIVRKILSIVCILFALMMVNAGMNKFFHYMPMPEGLSNEAIQLMIAFESSNWLLPLIGIAEIVGGVLIAIPKFRALGALIMLPVMIGILLFNLTMAPQNAPIAVVLFIINIWAIIADREKFMVLINPSKVITEAAE